MDDILNVNNFESLATTLSDPELRREIRLLSVFGCAAAEVIYATKDDKVFGYGRNRFGGLGLGIETEVKSPQLNRTLSGKRITNFVVGFEHWIALTATGHCYVWGHNQKGQLGIGSRDPSLTPQLIKGLAHEVVVQISCGGFHNLALTGTGQVGLESKFSTHSMNFSLISISIRSYRGVRTNSVN